MASLLVIRGPSVGTQFTLREGSVRIGRDGNSDIHFDDNETSRNHAEIHWSDGHCVIKDLNSSNGTLVNGKKIQECVLESGDRIQIGKRVMVYRPTAPAFKPVSNVDIVHHDAEEGSQIIGRAELGAVGRSDLEDPSRGTVSYDNEHHADLVPNRSTWEIMYRTSVAVSRTLDIDQLLRQILELIFQWVACDHGCIMLADPETGHLRPSYRKNRRPNSKHRMMISKTILDYVLKNEEGVLTSDARDDGRWKNSASIEKSGICEAICVPMRGRYGMVGVIYIDTIVSAGKRAHASDARVFNEEHLKMLVTVGHQAALAIEDTTYYQSMLQAERLAAIGQTIATLSHHVKNILQGLRGGGFMVTEGLKRENLDSIRTGWGICERTHERIEALVLDMLTISKDRKPERKKIDLRDLIQEVVDMCKLQTRDTPIQLQWTRPDSFPTLMLDGEAIHRAIVNLVINAIDACSDTPDGRVTIGLLRNEENAVVEVTDNGVGISKQDQNRIFSLFESTKGNRGTGLGLPVSLKIAREHGGNIIVASQIGQGATFSLELPWRSNGPPAESRTLPD
ncbi:MAG: ATP-binding protein [Planctomycetota bacterium]|jgi:signal transduction histidine kinase